MEGNKLVSSPTVIGCKLSKGDIYKDAGQRMYIYKWLVVYYT